MEWLPTETSPICDWLLLLVAVGGFLVDDIGEYLADNLVALDQITRVIVAERVVIIWRWQRAHFVTELRVFIEVWHIAQVETIDAQIQPIPHCFLERTKNETT